MRESIVRIEISHARGEVTMGRAHERGGHPLFQQKRGERHFLEGTTMSFKSAILAGVALLAGAGAANAAVVRGDLNLRSGPGTGYAVIEVMPAGSSVDVLSCTGGWCRVAYAGETGYASRSYLGGATTAYVTPPVTTYATYPYEYGTYAYDNYGYGPYAYDYDYYDYGPTIGFGFFGGAPFYRHHYRHFGYRHFGRRDFANRHVGERHFADRNFSNRRFGSGRYRGIFASAPSGFERTRTRGNVTLGNFGGRHFRGANFQGHASGRLAGNFAASHGATHAMHIGGAHVGGGHFSGSGHVSGHFGGRGGHGRH